MKQKRSLLGYYNYTVILTYVGLLAGFAGVICAMRQSLRAALAFLLAAGVCDMFDGAIASTMERSSAEKRFGIQIDSLSDLVCFGVLPAVFLCSLSGSGRLCFAVAAAYLLCTLIRLAYFNVLEEERQSTEAGRRESYQGMPVTMVSVFLPAMNALCRFRRLISPAPYCALLLFSGAAYLCPVTIRKPKALGKAALVALGVAEAAVLVLSLRWDV